jgi:hypothetical protein
VPRGDYVAKVARPGGAYFGMQYVTVVDGDPPPVRVTAAGAATLEGRIVIEGPPDLYIAGRTVSFAPGSSGWPRGDGTGDRVAYELFARGGNAVRLFGDPPAGTTVEVLS